MKTKLLASLLALSAPSMASALNGPFSHTSNGTTKATDQCLSGMPCVYRASAAGLGSSDVQLSEFFLTTGKTVGNDHFAFGVRGDSNDEPTSRICAVPFRGRGFIIYPTIRTAYFENFTTNCVEGAGRIESTAKTFSFLPNTKYRIEVWADHQNTSYTVERLSNQTWIDVAQGDCLAEVSAAEASKCGRHLREPGSANRVFIGHTEPTPWSVQGWFFN